MRSNAKPYPLSQRGFSLIEALVATTLSAALLGAVMQSLSGAGRLSDRVGKRSEAMLLAQWALSGPAENGQGAQGAMRWERAVETRADSAANQLVAIRVSVTAPAIRRPVKLSALKVVAK